MWGPPPHLPLPWGHTWAAGRLAPMPGNIPNDREDPRDANPMYKRLPAEVVSRRRHVEVVSMEGEEAVSVDRKAVFLLKPEQRLKWLAKALRQAEEGRLRPSDLYDVVSSSRFADSIPPKVGKKMGKALHEQIAIFTAKQQKFLSEQAEITTRFGGGPAKNITEEKEVAKPKEVPVEGGPDIDEMMARCRAFVRDKQRERGERNGAEEEGAGQAPEQPVGAAEAGGTEAALAPASEAAAPAPEPAAVDSAAVASATVAAAARAVAAAEAASGAAKAVAKAEAEGGAKRSKGAKERSRSRDRSRSHSRKGSRSRSRSDKQKAKKKREAEKKAEKKEAERKEADKKRDGRKEREPDRGRGRSRRSSSSSSSSSRERGRRRPSDKKKRPARRGSSGSSSSSGSARRRGSRKPAEKDRKQQPHRRTSSSSEPSKRHGGGKSKKARR